MLDFTNEQEQTDRNYGPIPAGSIVIVKLELQNAPETMQWKEPYIYQAKSGLLMLNFICTVTAGTYQGVHWYQRITLPAKAQIIGLEPKQETACSIGGAMLKAILQAAKKPLQINSYQVFNGLTIPVKVKIGNNPYVANGNTYWKNEIAKIITPEMPEYMEVKQARQIINPDGAVKGIMRANEQVNNSQNDYGNASSKNDTNETDSVPF